MSPPPADPEKPVSHSSARQWQARIIDPDGTVRGSGVLISERHVLTCAHVLADGLEPPAGPFTIDFPRSQRQPSVTGKVPDGGWFPELASGRQDVAVLEFDDPIMDADVVPARLHPAHGSYGKDARVYGHPQHAPEGFWSRITITDTTGPYGERVQLSGRFDGPGDVIAQGFSGGGVYNEDTGAVIGIVVTTMPDREWIAAWMIPVEIAAGYCHWVSGVLPDASPPEPPIDRSGLDSLADLLSRFRHLAAPSGRQQIAERMPLAPLSRLPHPPPTIRDLVGACLLPSELRVLADLVRYFDKESVWNNRLEKQLELLGVISSDAPPEQDQLTEASRQDLRDALAQVPYFRDAQNRHHYLEAFQRRVRNELHAEIEVQKSLDAMSDAAVLVETCGRVPGSLRVLPKDFPAGEQADPGLRSVIVLIGFLTDGRMLLARERAELLALINDVPVPQLKIAHRRVVPWVAGEVAPATPALILDQVEGQSQRPGELPRILAFAEHLALRQEAHRVSLRAWTDRVAARQRLDRGDVESLRRQLRDAVDDSHPPVLTIQLAPDAMRPKDRFLFSAILDHGGSQRTIASSDDPEGIETVRQRLDNLLDDVHHALDSQTERLTVEVVVPRPLLTEQVDRWDVVEAIPVPIGEKYPVVLRSYERLRQQRLWPQWGHKWRLAQEQTVPNADAMHFIGGDDSPSARDVYETLSSDDRLVLAIGRPPAQQTDMQPYDAYAGALQAGVAYLIWVRDVDLGEDLRRALSEALAGIPVRELPELITSWRAPRSGSAGRPGPAGLGRHVSLMACDHDRRAPFAGRELGSPRRRPS